MFKSGTHLQHFALRLHVFQSIFHIYYPCHAQCKYPQMLCLAVSHVESHGVHTIECRPDCFYRIHRCFGIRSDQYHNVHQAQGSEHAKVNLLQLDAFDTCTDHTLIATQLLEVQRRSLSQTLAFVCAHQHLHTAQLLN